LIKKYKLVSTATIGSGYTRQKVLQGLIKLGINPNQAELILSKKVTIKQDLDYAKALAYKEKFNTIGADLNVVAYTITSNESCDSTHAPDHYEALNQSFAKPFRIIKPGLKYKISLSFVILATLVGPLIYFGILYGSTSGLWWYFSEGRHQLFGALRPNFWILTLTFLVPAFVGTILILFLLYPLWPSGRAPKPFQLDRKKNARFYRAIESLAKSIGVPAPKYIELIPEPNAAAGPTKGLFTLARGELKLVLGLTLIGGSNIQQLMGVIAHEFGHFSQKYAMFSYHLINSVNRWMGECAFGQDEWHERLERWSEEWESGIGQICLFFAFLMINLVRFIFIQLFKLSLWLTLSMSRQMEFDADQYEVQLTGSKQYRKNTLNLRKLNKAWYEIMEMNYYALHEKDILLSNMPAAAIAKSDQYSPFTLKQLEESLSDEQTQFWNSHPADQERITHAEKLNEEGRLCLSTPAKEFIADYEMLCEQLTRYFYYQHEISGANDFIRDNPTFYKEFEKANDPSNQNTPTGSIEFSR
jgi:Zn-dependent protease with chaperone function